MGQAINFTAAALKRGNIPTRTNEEMIAYNEALHVTNYYFKRALYESEIQELFTVVRSGAEYVIHHLDGKLMFIAQGQQRESA